MQRFEREVRAKRSISARGVCHSSSTCTKRQSQAGRSSQSEGQVIAGLASVLNRFGSGMVHGGGVAVKDLKNMRKARRVRGQTRLLLMSGLSIVRIRRARNGSRSERWRGAERCCHYGFHRPLA